jgi:hypothetical protein
MDARLGRFEGMDNPFAGDIGQPLSLHAYLYSADDPINRVDPSGLDSPLNLLIGQAAHDAITQDFLHNAPVAGKVSNVSLSSLAGSGSMSRQTNLAYKIAFGVGFLARPDLASEDSHVIFEIKPLSQTDVGFFQVVAYLDALNYLDPEGNWTAGTDVQFTPIQERTLEVPGLGAVDIVVLPPQYGVVTYVKLPSQTSVNTPIASVGALVAGYLAAATAQAATSTLGTAVF